MCKLVKRNNKIYCELEAYNFKCTCCSPYLTQFEWESDNQKYYFRYKNGLGELYNITTDEDYNNLIMQFEDEYYKEFTEKEFINAMEKQNWIIKIRSRNNE